KVECFLAMANAAIRQKDAASFSKYQAIVLSDPAATNRQKIRASMNELGWSLSLAGNDAAKVQAAIDKAMQIPYLAKGELNTIYTAAMNFYKAQKMYEPAIKYIELQARVGQGYR